MVGIGRGVGAALGIGATIANAIVPSMRTWHILNVDIGEELEGDFEATDVSQNISADWARHYSLNRQDPISQFLHGNADTITFRGWFRQAHALDDAKKRFDKLKAWAARDPALRRPPIVLFWIGDGTLNQQSVIDSISATYESPTVLGAVRGIEFTIALTKYETFDLESGPPPETRYHHAGDGDYHELVAVREYGDPILGDVVRKRQPELQVVEVGDIIKLPSLEAIRRVKVEPKSVALQGLTSRKDSPQKTLRDFHFERHNKTFTSTVLPDGL